MNIYRETLLHYGIEKQIIKLAEESSELAQACCKHYLYDDNHDNLIEEMADTYIVMQQIIEYYYAKNYFEEVKNRKLIKLAQRMKEE